MENTKELLVKEMTRAEFLRFGLMAIVALFGIHNFMGFLHQQQKHVFHAPAKQSGHGFGSSKFGV